MRTMSHPDTRYTNTVCGRYRKAQLISCWECAWTWGKRRCTSSSAGVAVSAILALPFGGRFAPVSALLAVPRQVVRAKDCRVQVAEESVLQPVDPAVDLEVLPALPRIAGDGGVADIGHLFNDV